MPVEPRIFNADELAQVEALAHVLNTEQMADYFGIGRTTFYEIMDRQPDVSERYKKGRAKGVGGVAKGLLKSALEGNTTAQIFYLKTQAGWKETTINEVVDKTPPQKKMTTEELQAELETMGVKVVEI